MLLQGLETIGSATTRARQLLPLSLNSKEMLGLLSVESQLVGCWLPLYQGNQNGAREVMCREAEHMQLP